MTRKPRKQSPANIYHVTNRGVSRQIIFEDDADRERFLVTLRRFMAEFDGELYAWCLMSNHFHLLFHMDLEDISLLMKKVGVSYAAYFKAKYGISKVQAHRDVCPTDCPGTNFPFDAIAYGGTAPATVESAPAQPTSSGNGSIAEVQSWLGCAADGIYGPDTKRHLVRRLQQELNAQFGAGLADDGYWGPKTRAACVNVRRGASGNITRVLQGALICHGYNTGGFDGVFGSKTYDAVRDYQKSVGLSDDGIAGKNTFASLLG